jgi:hypothetical protein
LVINIFKNIMTKKNYWEMLVCGREFGGENEKELGACPASISGSGDGLNSGKNRGRICWTVAGTRCGGTIQGTYAEKIQSCFSCEFYAAVREEEGDCAVLLMEN